MKKYTQGIGLLAVIVVVAVLALVGGGAYYASHNSAEVRIENDAATTTTSGTSLKELLGKNVMCTFTTVEEGRTIEGTAYIAGESIRVDATASQDTTVLAQTHMIKVGTDAYVWSSSGAAAGQGAKMKVSANAESQTQDGPTLDWDKRLNYDCSDWTPDQTKFSVPTTITFTDLSAVINSKINTNQ